MQRKLSELTRNEAGGFPLGRLLRLKPATVFDRVVLKKFRIFLIVCLIGVISGAIQLGLPAEDAFKAARDYSRERNADDDVIAVVVDDRSLNRLGLEVPTRSNDAQVLDNLFAGGVDRVFFDRAHADPTTELHDARFEQALAEHENRIFLGAFPQLDEWLQWNEQLLPLPRFREHTSLVSMMGERAPFGFAIRFPTSTEIGGEKIPSISAAIAGYEGPERWYRVDYSVRLRSIPTVSYIDVLEGNFAADRFEGRTVIIGNSYVGAPDVHPLPFGGEIAGMYFHVLGAQAIKNGLPIELGWVPLLIFVCAVIGHQITRSRPSLRVAAGVFVLLIGAPFVGDAYGVTLDVFPAILTMAIGFVWLAFSSRGTHHHESGLLRISAMKSSALQPDHDVFVLKVKNFAVVSASLPDAESGSAIKNLIERIKTSEGNIDFASDRDLIVWLKPKMGHAQIQDHARGLHSLFHVGLKVGKQLIDVSTAIGIDVSHDQPIGKRIEDAVQSAEEAAKLGQICCIADLSQSDERKHALRRLSELDFDLENGSVGVAFQPKVRLSDGVMVGAEALLRWEHPEYGLVSPASIITLAEEHKRIDRLTIYVLKKAYEAAWQLNQDRPGMRISVNVSVTSLSSPEFTEQLDRILKDGEIDPTLLMLEITETSPIDAEHEFEVLKSMKEMGFALSIDDFGTGLATIDYLRKIPADEVKIDKSFVLNIEHSAEDLALVRSAASMIHSLNRKIVAEGVESARAAELLRQIGCDYGQGYYYSPALPLEELPSTLVHPSSRLMP